MFRIDALGSMRDPIDIRAAAIFFSRQFLDNEIGPSHETESIPGTRGSFSVSNVGFSF